MKSIPIRFLHSLGQTDAAVANTVQRPNDKLINETAKLILRSVASDAGNNEETMRGILKSFLKKAIYL